MHVNSSYLSADTCKEAESMSLASMALGEVQTDALSV